MVEHLPRVNALLNLASAGLLAGGFYFIRRRMINFHRACMVAAFGVSVAFLISYLVYHAHVGHVPYRGQGTLRALYFSILLTHTVLAVVIVPLVLRTLYLAVKCRYKEHRRWARWTLPLWFYVSVTGVVVYEMLYG